MAVVSMPFILNTARELIRLGVDVNAIVGGITPIFYASRNPEMVHLLIQAGCDVHYRDGNRNMTLLMCTA